MTPTNALSIVAFYAGLNGLILLMLSAHVSRIRGVEKVSIGDGGRPAMVRAMRGQANFTEYVPFVLIGMALLALLGSPPWQLHGLGIVLTVGRVLHGWHFAQADAPGWQRFAGASMTFIVLALASLALILRALTGMG